MRLLLLPALVLFLAVETGYSTVQVVQKKIYESSALEGHVLVGKTDEPANGVTVELRSDNWKTVLASTKTDKKGFFSFGKPADRKLFYIRVSAPGMNILDVRVRLKEQAAKELTIRLSVAT